MELSGVVVLALMSFVTATPHGYGVKSGAIAKAEANAASAAFLPPIPLSIPNGAGFSGSFSKSSSSSFASSSSSASSSSFSFSGSGTNGIPDIGCSSNSCKNAENAPSSQHGTINTFNGIQSSGAVASASAGAIAGSFAGNLSGNKCLLGKCSPNNNLQPQSQAVSPINKYENGNDCASGNCNPSIHHDVIPSSYGSQNQGSIDNSGINGLDTNNKGGSNGVPPSDCSNGKCGIPSTAISSVEQGDDIFIPLSQTSNPTASGQQKPSIYLSAPSIEPACTSHICNQASIGSYSNDKLPTSYNVPILGPNPSAPQTLSAPSAPACDSPNCAANPPANNDVSGPAVHSDSLKPHKGGQYQPEYTDFPIQQNAPSFSNHNFNPNKEQKNVNTYTGNAAPTGNTAIPSESLDGTKPILSTSTSNDENNPKYTGGFGGANGSINRDIHAPSKSTAGVSQPIPNYSQTLNSNYDGSTQHGSKNSYGYSSSDSSNIEPSSTPHDSPKPNTNYLSPNQRPDELTSVGSLPSRPGANIFTTPSYSGQTSSLTQNNHNGLHTSVGSQGYHGQYVTPKTGDTSPNPNLSSPPYNNGFGVGSNGKIGHGSSNTNFGTTNSHSTVLSAGKDAPVYTGGFGGPIGTIDKNFPIGTQTRKPGYVTDIGEESHTSINSGANTGLNIGTSKPGTFISSPRPNPNSPTNSVGFAGPSGSSNGNFGLGITKPHSHVIPAGKDAPIYTGGFGGPTGLVDISIPVPPSKVNNLSQESVHTSSGGGVSSDSSIHSDLHSGVSKPSDTLVPPHHDITNHGTHDSPTEPHSPSKSKPNNEEPKLPAYTGGFGAPSGLLKPNEYNLPAKLPSPGIFNPVPCTTGACDATVKSGASNEKVSIPNKEASAATTASASAKAVAYSNGFGGPPGLLKPFDSGKHSNSQSRNDLSESKGQHGSRSDLNEKDIERSLSPSLPSSGQAQAGAQAVTGAQANAVAFASAGAFGVNQGTSGAGCSSGCGSNVNSAGHFANSGSHSFSKSGLGEINDVTGATAVANSAAGAGAGASAGSLARGRSFASAHASAGAAVKGGYGK